MKHGYKGTARRAAYPCFIRVPSVARNPSSRTRSRRQGTQAAVALPEAITPQWLKSFRERLRRWHKEHGRDLPWRGAGAYRVWISEIMLQQTTVAAVIPYYERFLAAFPTVQDLADADEQQVLRLWEGLGYYSRARNLHRAARVVVDGHGGELPDEVETLQSLPGIGRYTAGAIASFGYDRRAPIVEANTLRLYTRLLDFDGDPRSAAGQQLLWRFAEAVVPATHPGEFNQALTDHGALVCVPDEPRCEACPVMTLCGARQAGRERELPQLARRPELTDVVECAVVVEHRGRYLLRRCQPGERWAGLWDFPRFAVGAEVALPVVGARKVKRRAGTATEAAQLTLLNAEHSATMVPARLAAFAAAEVERLTGVKPQITSGLADLRHGVTRFRIRLICLRGTARGASPAPVDPALCWVDRAGLEQLPLSTTGRKIASRL
jgi:A/G-specific adenine glycosylase